MDNLNLIETRKNKEAELDNMLNVIKQENRKFTSIEEKIHEDLKNEISNLSLEIEAKRSIPNIVIKDAPKERFSILQSIRDIAEGRHLSESTLNMLDNGKREFAKAGMTYRGQLILPAEYRATIEVGSTGGYVPAEDKFSLLGALRSKLVLAQAGATFYNNLVGDVSIPVYGGSSSAWATETGTTADGGGTFSEVTLSPKRLVTYIDISKQFLAQDGIGAEQAIMNDLYSEIAYKVENTAFDATASSTSRPAGLFYNASFAGTLSGTTTYAKLIGIKSAVDTANALTGNLAYITSPTLSATLETTSTDTGSGIFCMNNNKIAGYPVYVTSNIPTLNTNYQGIAFGNWSDYVIGQWAGLDITIDPYTQAIYGKVRLVVNTYWDFKVRRSASFKLSQLA